MRKALKWVVITLIAVSTFLNYIDRQTLSLLSHAIQGDLHIDDKGYAFLVSVFLFAYAGGNLVSGVVIDKLGTRIALPVFVAWWSLANALSGFVPNAEYMAMTRFALGLAEIGGFICAPVLVRQFFPPRQRAFAIGLYTAAAMFGATVAPPLITGLGAVTSWRFAFIILGLAGLVWSGVWLLVAGGKNNTVASGAAEEAEPEAVAPAATQDIGTWWKALTNRAVWGISIGTMLTFPTWYFYLFWFPKYLTDERGLSTLAMGRKTWIVYLAAGLGSLTGGYVSGFLIKRGLRPKASRLWIMLAACLLAPAGALIALEPNITVALGLASFIAFLHMIWQANVTVLPTDLFPAKDQAKCFAISGFITALAGMGSNWLIGQLLGLISYRPMFVITSCLYPVAVLVVYLMTRDAKPRLAARTLVV